MRIYANIRQYSHANFSVAILRDLGPKGTVSLQTLLAAEQEFIDLAFQGNPLLRLNSSPISGSTLGLKWTTAQRTMRSGPLNPMHGKVLSAEFLAMQDRDKSGANNPQYGVVKSSLTIAKLTKLVYVYDLENNNTFIGEFSTVNCSKHFSIGKDTLRKYLQNGLPFKGKLFTRIKR